MYDPFKIWYSLKNIESEMANINQEISDGNFIMRGSPKPFYVKVAHEMKWKTTITLPNFTPNFEGCTDYIDLHFYFITKNSSGYHFETKPAITKLWLYDSNLITPDDAQGSEIRKNAEYHEDETLLHYYIHELIDFKKDKLIQEIDKKLNYLVKKRSREYFRLGFIKES